MEIHAKKGGEYVSIGQTSQIECLYVIGTDGCLRQVQERFETIVKMIIATLGEMVVERREGVVARISCFVEEEKCVMDAEKCFEVLFVNAKTQRSVSQPVKLCLARDYDLYSQRGKEQWQEIFSIHLRYPPGKKRGSDLELDRWENSEKVGCR
ncbi:MAG: hypothetical protein KC736_01055 [Candidatus Moranbacteria bacterium]|nr:hypothetical protein [Candidatus Moranbacteria bacterium]